MSKKSIPAIIIFVWVFVFIICPLAYVFILSFMTKSELYNVEFRFTLLNYIRLFDKTRMSIYFSSLMIALLTTVFALLIGYPFGYLLANTPKKRRAPLILLIMVPFWTNSLLRLTGWKILLQSDGIINTLLTSIGLIDADHRLMLMNNYVSVLVVTVYMLLPFMILPVYNSVDKLDKAVIEASKDLGAGRLRTFARVTLPLTVPGIASGVMLVFIPAIGIFFISDVIGDGKTMLLGNLIQNQFSFSRNWPFGAALSVIMITGMLIFVFLMLKASKNEEGGLINF